MLFNYNCLMANSNEQQAFYYCEQNVHKQKLGRGERREFGESSIIICLVVAEHTNRMKKKEKFC